ncbi:MAG: 2Fe-2S iron-sulfur cluster-binding protein, partial [Xanthobacteraceae bacterium]
MILGSRTWSNWRSWLRLLSALTMLTFVICHLTAHCFLLISFDDAETARRILMYPWRGWTGTIVLSTAFLIHYTNALWSIYVRRSLRLKPWEWTQLALGLCIPVLLTSHVVATRISEHVLDTTTYYNTVFIAQWVIDPWFSAVQMLAIVTVWTHACIGINYWLRVRTWYPKWRPFLFTYALLLPTLALAGYVTGGNQVLREAKDHDFVDSALADANLTDENRAAIDHMADIGWILCFTLPLLPFAGRGLRDWYHRSQRPPILAHASGCSMRILPGATVLETLRANGVAHASVCGGRARCTTCRIMVTKGLDDLPPPSTLEAKALSRIGAAEG